MQRHAANSSGSGTSPTWTDTDARVDAAVFYAVTAQVNLANLLDRRDFLYADNNDNITPRSATAVKVSLAGRF